METNLFTFKFCSHQVFSRYRDLVKELLDSGELKRLSFRNQVKPVALRNTPKSRYSVLIQDNSTDPCTYIKRFNLSAIPLQYLKYRAADKKVLLRQDAETSLSDLKAFHA